MGCVIYRPQRSQRMRRGIIEMEGTSLSKLWKWTASFGLDLNLNWKGNYWEYTKLVLSSCSPLDVQRVGMLSCGGVGIWGEPQDASFRPVCPGCLRGLGELLPTPPKTLAFSLQKHTNPGLRRARSKVCLIFQKMPFREDA